MKPIDKATAILQAAGKQFVIIVEGENHKGMEVRQRFNYVRGMAMFSVIAESLMDDYVETLGYVVHADLYDVLKETMMRNEKQPNEELVKKVDAELRELAEDADFDELTRSISSNANMSGDDVQDMIHALRCCAEQNCVECPRLPEKNDETIYCSQALMIEARIMLEEFADETRKA